MIGMSVYEKIRTNRVLGGYTSLLSLRVCIRTYSCVNDTSPFHVISVLARSGVSVVNILYSSLLRASGENLNINCTVQSAIYNRFNKTPLILLHFSLNCVGSNHTSVLSKLLIGSM